MPDLYRVAVVVTCEVTAADYADAVGIAEAAVKQTLTAGTPCTFPPLAMEVTKRGHTWHVGVQSIRPLDTALRNGHIRLEVTPPRHAEETTDA